MTDILMISGWIPEDYGAHKGAVMLGFNPISRTFTPVNVNADGTMDVNTEITLSGADVKIEDITIKTWGTIATTYGYPLTETTFSGMVVSLATQPTVSGIRTELAEHEFNTPTNAGIDVTVLSTQILAANTARLYASIINDSDTTVYLSLGAEAGVSSGIRINSSGGSYEITWNNLYRGAINGIHGGSGNKRVTVVEGT